MAAADVMPAGDANGITPTAASHRLHGTAVGEEHLAVHGNRAFTEVSDPLCLPDSPSVSVLMLVHNHAPYLAEAIEGVLSQTCDFPFELLIGEDASSDDSLAIALRYQQLHPGTIRVIRWHSNVGMNANQRQLFALARGDFFAYCEGDDYWCHPGKLGGQRALLQANATAGCVHADWVRARPVHGGFRIDWGKSVHRRVPLASLQGDLFRIFNFPKILRTCTLMQRRSAVEAFHASELSIPDYRFVDTVRSSYISSRWPVLYWPEVAAVYRESPGSALRSGRHAFMGFLRSSLSFDDDARRFFAGRGDYPWNYRWECAIGLLLHGLRSCDARALVDACRDLRRHYTARSFLRAATTALRLRWPTMRPNRLSPRHASRSMPPAASALKRTPGTVNHLRRSLRQFVDNIHVRLARRQYDSILPP